MGFARSKERGR